MRYQGENNALRLKLIEANGNPITLTDCSIAFYDHNGALIEEFTKTESPSLFSFENNILSFIWNVNPATYPAGQYYAVWTYEASGQIYKTQVAIEVREAPNLA